MMIYSNILLGNYDYQNTYIDEDNQINYLFIEQIENSYDVILRKFTTL